jgi:hypothetical protein
VKGLHGTAILFLLCTVGYSGHAGSASSPMTQDGSETRSVTQHDGPHDFDFSFGAWKTHIKRLKHPLSGSTEWVEYEGTSIVGKVWNGRGGIGETEADGPAGHLEALSLRLYNPQARQWNLTYASGPVGVLSVPSSGEFKNGRGEFFDIEAINGKSVLVRQVWSHITADSCRFEQAFSVDGGKSWEVNWSAIDTRIKDETDGTSERATGKPEIDAEPDAQYDFDFNFGTWKTHVSRLDQPLTGSTTWLEYDGTSVVRKLWGGRASLFELEVDGPAGHIEGVGLRLYNAQSHQWSLNWASSRDGKMEPAMIGEFKNGRGEFYDQESPNGRAIFARNSFSDITPDSSRFEQAFSDNYGKTWETNWVMIFTRRRDGAEKGH